MKKKKNVFAMKSTKKMGMMKSKKKSKEPTLRCPKKEQLPCGVTKSSSDDGIVLCHYDSKLDTYQDLCVTKSKANKSLKRNAQSKCGPCANAALRILDAIDDIDNLEEARDLIEPEELKRFTGSVKAWVGVDLQHMVTEEGVIRALFPDPNATFRFPNFEDDSLFDASSEPNGRGLTVYDGQSARELLILEYFFDDLPEGCESKTISAIAGAVGVVLSFFKIKAAAKPVTKTLFQQADKSVPMLRALFAEVQLSWFIGSLTDKAKAIWGLVSPLLTAFGVKAFWKAVKTDMTTADILLTAGSILSALIGLFLTNGYYLIWEIVNAGFAIGVAINEAIKFVNVCFPEEENFDKCGDFNGYCDDRDLCTIDKAVCDESTDYWWECEFIPVSCPQGMSCDWVDGECKLDEQLTPCIAVIDEDDSFGNGVPQEDAWRTFRETFPNRPFCLLIPHREGGMSLPQNFKDDPLTSWHYNITRDNGNAQLAESWVEKCGLNFYNEANVNWVGLFIDDSGSLHEYEVGASRDLFYSELQAKGIQIRKVVNKDENWILPFLTDLSPAPECITADGLSGNCLDEASCERKYGMNAALRPWKLGDPEPNCRALPAEIQCCVNLIPFFP